MPIVKPDYTAPRWLPGAHLQTVVPARFFPRPEIHYRREIVAGANPLCAHCSWKSNRDFKLN